MWVYSVLPGLTPFFKKNGILQHFQSSSDIDTALSLSYRDPIAPAVRQLFLQNNLFYKMYEISFQEALRRSNPNFV